MERYIPILFLMTNKNSKTIAKIRKVTPKNYEEAIQTMINGKNEWMAVIQILFTVDIKYAYCSQMPAPLRGEIVRQIGDAFRKYKEPLGKLISLEMGKILSEGYGEVQEFIDICDMAVGTLIPLNIRKSYFFPPQA